MPMSARLMRPIKQIAAALAAFIMTNIAGEEITDQTGDPLRTIQNA